MKVSQWAGPGYRVSQAQDRFFNAPLQEMTLFRFETAGFEVEPHAGEFSLKVVLRGAEEYRLSRRTITLRPGQLLLVNAGTPYASRIAGTTESLSVFFRADELAAAAGAVRDPIADCLDALTAPAPAPWVPQVALEGSIAFAAQLRQVTAALDARDDRAAEQYTRSLLLAALEQAWRIASPDCLTDVRRRATRDELVARVQRARRLIDDGLDRDLDLDALATEACLSRYHFLRVFRAVVGRTPVAYLRRQRLTRARDAIVRGLPPDRAARRAGYRDLRSFHRAWRREFELQDP